MNARLQIRILILVICVSGIILFAQPLFASHNFRIAFLDIGQGDAIFIESPTGRQMIIDGGPSGSFGPSLSAPILGQLSDIMGPLDRTVDVVVSTHPDADHIGGLASVFSRYEVGTFIDPGISSETVTYSNLMSAVADEHSEYLIARRGMKIDLGGGVTAEVLSPSGGKEKELNDYSIVIKISFGSQDILLTGDASIKIEKELVLADKDILQSEILKVGHHGSKTSSDPEFVKIVSPEYAIISVGKNNRYGHPNETALASLRDASAVILRTDELGLIEFESDENSLIRKR